MKVYTIQISKWRKAEKLGIPMKDITVKSGDKLFAPTWDFLMKHKQDKNDQDYIDKFIPLMRESYKNDKQQWLDLCNKEEVALACYCKAGDFCHRHLLVDILEKVCEANNIEFERKGEIE